MDKITPFTFACLPALTLGVNLINSSLASPVRPLPAHPGNVFVAGEPVAVKLPEAGTGSWRLTDYDGRLVQTGHSTNQQAQFGVLPVGWYEVVQGDDSAPLSSRKSLAVLAPLDTNPSADSPVALDVAMAWFYGREQMPAVANLCALAGVSWVRDRLNWSEVEPERGHFAGTNRYDWSAETQAAAGLRQLQVIHLSPRWANPDQKRFPLDLRDAHRFCREIARRWRGQMLAFEPWNEADIEVFGGHTGAEIASLQKAAWLGLKEENSSLIVCQNVFAVHQPAILEDFHANRAWPYFDTFNFHHYIGFEDYPKWYAGFREVSAGRPLWITECNVPVKWSGDDRFKEPAPNDLKIQAERVAKVFAASLHEQPAMIFYFLFPHYVEGQTQFGIVRPDLSPRPAYVALAAVGRLLTEARALGRATQVAPEVRAYWFEARPDGQGREIVVAWCQTGEADLELSFDPTRVFDHLGRQKPSTGNRITLSSAPVFIEMPSGSSRNALLDPPPARPGWLPGKASPVVIQARWPKSQVTLKESAYNIKADRPVKVPLRVYNFGAERVRGMVRVDAPPKWKTGLPERLELSTGEDRDIDLETTAPGEGVGGIGRVTITGDFGAGNQAVLSLRFKLDQ